MSSCSEKLLYEPAEIAPVSTAPSCQLQSHPAMIGTVALLRTFCGLASEVVWTSLSFVFILYVC